MTVDLSKVQSWLESVSVDSASLYSLVGQAGESRFKVLVLSCTG